MPTAPLNPFYKASGATTSRYEKDRWADIINVKDYGALGTGSGNDAPSIQAAFDAAFGTTASPHGVSGQLNNKAVFFPCGSYPCSSTLTLPKITGGRIFGAATMSTSLSYTGSFPGGGTITSLIKTNGAVNLILERLSVSCVGANSCAVNLDWDGSTTNCEGLHNNTLRDILTGGSTNSIIVADTGNDGANNLFENVTINGGVGGEVSGIDARGADAINQCTFLGGGTQEGSLYLASGGSFNITGWSVSGNATADLHVTANHTNTIHGGRVEGPSTVLMTTGIVAIRGVAYSGNSGSLAVINGGKCIIDACDPGVAVITGSGGSLYIRGGAITHTGYSGTVVQEI